MALPNVEDKLEFFKSEAHKYVFFLLNYQGAKLASALGAYWKHYCHPEVTLAWGEDIKETILKEFKGNETGISSALQNLKDLVEAMTEA